MKRTPYDMLPVLPAVIAEAVLGEEYTGQDLSPMLRSGRMVALVEAGRRALSQSERELFELLCERRCKAAYEVRAKWFSKCVTVGSNAGRDQLYMWIRHWLPAYILERERFENSLRRVNFCEVILQASKKAK